MTSIDDFRDKLDADRLRGRYLKIAAVVLVAAAQAENICRQMPEEAAGFEWVKLFVLTAAGVIVAASWWAILSDAFGRSWMTGLAALVFWPYTVVHGLVRMPGWKRCYGVAFGVSVGVSALSRWLAERGAGGG